MVKLTTSLSTIGSTISTTASSLLSTVSSIVEDTTSQDKETYDKVMRTVNSNYSNMLSYTGNLKKLLQSDFVINGTAVFYDNIVTIEKKIRG